MFTKITPLVIMVILLSIGIVAADNIGPRHHFVGNVFVNGHPAPDGVLVTAQFEGDDMRATLTYGGSFGYADSPYPYGIFVVPKSLGATLDQNDVIEFFVSGVSTGVSYEYEPDTLTYLDLSVEIHPFCGDGIVEGAEDCNTCPADAGECTPPPGPAPTGNGGSGGGGGGGGSPSCTENWLCSDWMTCFNGEQTRVCADQKQCGTNKDKPIEVQNCIVPASVEGENCNVGEMKCDGDNLLSCSPDGEFVVVDACTAGCSEGACIVVTGGNTEDTGGELTGTEGSNPLLDFFNSIFGFTGNEDGVTGQVTARSVTLGLFGLLIIIVIIIALAVLVLGRKKNKGSDK